MKQLDLFSDSFWPKRHCLRSTLSARSLLLALVALVACGLPAGAQESDEAELQRHLIQPGQLKRLVIETPLVRQGKPQAVIAIAEGEVYRQGAATINAALKETVGVELPVKPAASVSLEEAGWSHCILLGHLDNNPLVAHLYHTYYDCLDAGYTGKGGYEIRSVHDPFATGVNCIVAGGSDEEGAAAAAHALAKIIRDTAKGSDVVLPRLLELKLRPEGRSGSIPARLSPEEAERTLAQEMALFEKPGVGRAIASNITKHAVLYHRYGDPAHLELYRKLIERHIRYYAEDPYIRSSLRRYDREFRDSWAWHFVVTWDLLEEEPVFSDAERLAITNHCLRLVQECVLYQRWDRPEAVQGWAQNRNIVHNHQTWPALACYFGARYFGRYYNHPYAKEWKIIADGVFNGQKHAAKPQEDSASYQWLPLRHTIIWSLASGDHTFFTEGHARRAAENALMVVDNLGNQPAFGDHTDWTVTAGIPDFLGRCAWYYRDGRYLWGAMRAGQSLAGELQETYTPRVEPTPPVDHVGIVISRLPKQCYDHTERQAQYPVKPNLPYEESFDKLTFRDGLDPQNQYLLLDGYARGNHMHFDANAIIHFADRGACWLVDGEYIRNGPKYHNSLTVLRDGQSALLPAVAGLLRRADLKSAGFSSSRIVGYNGATWTRHLLWQKGSYFVVIDEVTAETPGDYTLGSTWRVLGEPRLEGNALTITQRESSARVQNADGLAGRIRFERMAGAWPIHALVFRVGRRLAQGETHLFRNLFYASSPNRPQSLKALPAGAEGVLVTGGPAPVWWGVSGPDRPARRGKLETDAALFRITPSGYALASARRLVAGGPLFSSDQPVDIELDAERGEGVLVSEKPAKVVLRLAPGATWTLGREKSRADADGTVRLELAPGRHTLKADRFALPAVIAEALVAPSQGAAATVGAREEPMPAAWTYREFRADRKPLQVQSIRCDQPHTGRYGPVEKLVDGGYRSSLQSVQWARGVAPEVTFDLGAVREIESVRIRAWELTEAQKGARRELWLSNDGFQNDSRRVDAEFAPAGTEEFGTNINFLYTCAVRQKARYVRLKMTPAGEGSIIYLAEVEFFGSDPDRPAEITALASGRLGPAGELATVASTANGEIIAIDASGKRLWAYQARGRVYALAVADLDGDGRDEVIAGGQPAWLLCLDATGKRRWEHRPRAYRGLAGDVITLCVGDLEADGKPEVVAGLLCWKYIAVDAEGKEKWDTVIYAHSATACALADVNGDGRRSVIAGNAYYRLNLLGPDGRVSWQNYTLGPEHTCVAAADLDGDGKEEILAGSDLGEFHAITGARERLWEVNAGDAVRAILTHRPKGAPLEVYAAGDSGFVYACKPDGSPRWKVSVGDAINGALLADVDGDGQPEIVAAAGSAGVVILGRDGKIRRSLRAASPVTHVQVLPGKLPRIVAALADGSLAVWPATPR
ncbi:MAG: hypothetical protein GX785_07425 [Armatimonadetes bacterium]|nr:hypothetical protein [Armatimonadota bacterium]